MRSFALGRPLGGAVFLILTTGVLWTALSDVLGGLLELLRLGLLALLFLAIRKLFMKDVASPTASGAIVMAIGIFINGAVTHFPLLNTRFAEAAAMALFLFLLFIAASYLHQAKQGRLGEKHLDNTIKGFAVGTWVAGISVCGVAMAQRLPEWRPLVQLMLFGNIILWLYYISRMGWNFIRLFATDAGRKVHGVLLLATVSTQSLVIMWTEAVGTVPHYRLGASLLIVFGLILYFISFYLIMRRYAMQGASIDLDRDWFNSNCILHGAMSISGLAAVVSHAIPMDLVMLMWLWAVAWFLIVECIETARAAKRVRLYGIRKALLLYDPSQWSRNFTFGMFYAFTLNFDISQSAMATPWLAFLHSLVLDSFAWVVVGLLLVEAAIFLGDRLFPGAAGQEKGD